jgi:nucleotide-binding universal stress UspA family protein
MSVADTIVVGMDGSPGAERAVRWAAAGLASARRGSAQF